LELLLLEDICLASGLSIEPNAHAYEYA